MIGNAVPWWRRQIASQVGILYERINFAEVVRLTALAARPRAIGRERCL